MAVDRSRDGDRDISKDEVFSFVYRLATVGFLEFAYIVYFLTFSLNLKNCNSFIISLLLCKQSLVFIFSKDCFYFLLIMLFAAIIFLRLLCLS